ncbi:MAG TPA: Gfo/Idh/MocA family oxidoreductase [Bryobacteraceae bacterium]|nr:Gfo/Idh/MocA family oxidoreductase [Bryobacteraceae bacterium]
MERTLLNNTAVKVAVVGVGYWGKNLVRTFNDLGALGALCDVQECVAAKYKNDHAGVTFYRELKDVLADPVITAVALATPAVTHYDFAKAALNAGKDVLVEKPLAVDVRHGQELVKLAEANHRVLMVGHILRYHPAILKLQELIRSGALGKINYLYSNRLNIGKIRTEENILWSFAPHDISVMLALLNEMPVRVSCEGGAYLSRDVADVTLSHFDFASGAQAHIFVSWLHPFKEQRLVVVGSEKMAVFEDTAAHKLILYPHRVKWENRLPTAIKAEGEIVDIESGEPLRAECAHFLECVESRRVPVTSGREGLDVLRILDACHRAMDQGTIILGPPNAAPEPKDQPFVHKSAYLDDGAEVGAGTKIWHFSHIMKGAQIGKSCIIGQNVNIDGGVTIGNNVKIQNNVSVYTGVVVEDDVFLGPSCVLTNVSNPRSQVKRHSLYQTTRLKRGATIGANATVVCGITVGRYAFAAAGSVITKDVPDFALIMGNPGRQVGWMSRHGHRLGSADENGIMRCPESGYRYKEVEPGILRCIDLDEESPLPAELTIGTQSYREFKKEERHAYTAIGS